MHQPAGHSARTLPNRRWRRFLEPRADGLPSVPLLISFPVLVLIIVILGTAFGLSGSSTGMWWILINGDSPDPSLLLGSPRDTTSDMWLVQDSWIASQAAQGFPAVNHTLPGGMDATFMNDLPAWEWSTFFRPHLWAYLFLPLAQGGAWRWLFIGGFAAASIYAFALSLTPRRPVVAVLLSAFVLCSPLIQWWYRPQTLLPLGWCFITLTAVVWAIRATPRSRTPIVLAALAGYFAIPAALTIYIPFIVPCMWVLILFTVGSILNARRTASGRDLVKRFVPLIVAATTAAAVLLIWAMTRLDTIRATLDTVYPGHRSTPTGECVLTADSCTATFAAAWSNALSHGVTGSLGGNSAEAATVIQLELFLAPVLIFLVVRSARRRDVDWLSLTTVLGSVLFLAFILIPGWDPLARVLGLESSVGTRMRLGLLILGVVSAVVVLSQRDSDPWERRTEVRLLAVVGVFTLFMQIAVWIRLKTISDPVVSANHIGFVAAVVIAIGMVLTVSKYPWAGIAALTAASLMIAGTVNPVYRGWTDLATSSFGQAVSAEDEADPGTWVGITTGSSLAEAVLPTGILLSTGVQAYNGVQTYPPEEMWSQIDPSGSLEDKWNRLAGVSWVTGTGEPDISNPARDQIQVTFDSCSSFAQSNVRHVLSMNPIEQDCLHLDQSITQGTMTAYIYSIEDR